MRTTVQNECTVCPYFFISIVFVHLKHEYTGFERSEENGDSYNRVPYYNLPYNQTANEKYEK